MGLSLRPFIDLLPYRVGQMVCGARLRHWSVRRRRAILPDTAKQTEGTRRLYIDLGVVSRHDAGTGIQRVVRAIALALLEENAPGWEIRFVSASRKRGYHCISWPDAKSPVFDQEIRARPGDIFFGLDFSLDAVRWHKRQLTKFRREGGALWFLVCDLLPLNRPKWFSPNAVIRYKAWLQILAEISDGFVCISRQTEADLVEALGRRFALYSRFSTMVVPMGHNILDSRPRNMGQSISAVQSRLDGMPPFLLMVGTLEPRKGHADVLSAFDKIWNHDDSAHLVLVGKLGWNVSDLERRILNHPKHGTNLIWLNDVSDLELDKIYSLCHGVIIASHGEGFGLPLIESLGHRKPVLARDLPVFRDHEDKGILYFPRDASAEALAGCIENWISKIRSGEIKVVPPSGSWKRSALDLLSVFESS